MMAVTLSGYNVWVKALDGVFDASELSYLIGGVLH